MLLTLYPGKNIQYYPYSGTCIYWAKCPNIVIWAQAPPKRSISKKKLVLNESLAPFASKEPSITFKWLSFIKIWPKLYFLGKSPYMVIWAQTSKKRKFSKSYFFMSTSRLLRFQRALNQYQGIIFCKNNWVLPFFTLLGQLCDFNENSLKND